MAGWLIANPGFVPVINDSVYLEGSAFLAEEGYLLLAPLPDAELKRVKELEAENAKLKRMYADLALENAAIKEVLSRKL